MIDKSPNGRRKMARFASRVLRDGHLHLPASIAKKLSLRPGVEVTAVLEPKHFDKRKLLEFAGVWKDMPDAELEVLRSTVADRRSFKTRFPSE